MEYGKPDAKMDLKDFVLQKVSCQDRKVLDAAITNAADAVEEILKRGIDIAMNKFN